MEKVWKVLEPDPRIVDELARAFRLPPPVAQAVINRGYTEQADVEAYLQPRLTSLSDPFLLPSMDVAVNRIWEAIMGEEPILVYGDYDVDGITSTTLLHNVLTALGASISTFIPHRIKDGYGLSVESLRQCVELHHPALIVTVDCGTGSVEAAAEAQRLGVDIIVTDHHEPPAEMAEVLALVNPKLGEDEMLMKLAGVGVAFKLCHALVKRGRDEGDEAAAGFDLKQQLYLVALGTVADMVPLVDENRVLARTGIAGMNKEMSIGLDALKSVASIQSDIESYHIGFLLGPRLNAAGRLANPATALELLLEENPMQAETRARELDSVNMERQAVEAEIVENAVTRLDAQFDPDRDYSIVVSGEGWHPGVVGIVASRLVQRYHRPSVVIGINDEGIGKGSCRSISGFDLVQHLDRSSGHLRKYGGHQMAAGLEIRAGDIDAFREEFNEVAAATLRDEDLRPVVKIDGWIDWNDVTGHLLAWTRQMEPFGLNNPRPVWAVRDLEIRRPPEIVGKRHLKMQLGKGNRALEVIGFNMAERELPGTNIDLAFSVYRNEYRGVESMQLRIEDFRPAQAAIK